jgi:hypothetical protein
MKGRTPLAWLALCVLVGACSGASGGEQPEDSRHMEGVVIKVNTDGLGDISSFEVKNGPTVREFFIDDHAEYSFPVDHLSEHLASGQPVRVDYVSSSGELTATQIDDA